jgi:hypothetical protein
MKACPVCALELEDTCLFCPEDGSPLERAEAGVIAEQMPENQTRKASIEASNVTNASPVVLYCPACAAEYPLTFSDCPVHGVPLTKHRIPTFDKPPARMDQRTTELPIRAESHVREEQSPIHQKAQSAASHSSVIAATPADSYSLDGEPSQAPLVVKDEDEIDYHASSYEHAQAVGEEPGPDRLSFKIAAIMIGVGLAVLSLIGLYVLYTNATRKPASQTARSSGQSLTATPESAFIPTPEEARDYKEEPLAETTPVASPAKDDNGDEKESARAGAPAHSSLAAQRDEENKSRAASYQPSQMTTPTPVAAKRPASGTDIVLPRGTYGLVDARLLRVRGRQTASGYRYDLTFNLQEQAGRTTQWDRLSVATRAASGTTHSEVMPFYHRLGAAGTLTFTVSVELKGRSQADWQGRIICTSIGTDTQGRALRTSFGANVSP